jgi:hypothetical protein
MKKILYTAVLFLFGTQLSGQVPILNSINAPGPVIFLDFDGHIVDNTAWNYSGPIVCNASSLNNTQITEIFERVAEDFRSFTVNITTDSTKYTAAPVNKRMRVLITPSYEWYGSAGGVSFIGSFAWGDDSPCFVFSSLLNNNVKLVSEAISHEAGHTLGLYHQAVYNNSCVKTSEYNYGAGSGETGWAPIMGIGYYQNVTTWHNGPNPYGCANMQNERDIIASAINGITVKADDNNNTSANAPSLIISNNQFSTTGNFEQINDEDLYKLQVITPARVNFSAKPANVGNMNAGANSDILVGLYNQSLLLLKTSNPSDSLQASIDTLLNTGTYYIRLKPVANTYASTYGMSGMYIINGMITPSSTLPLRKLELTGKADGIKHRLQWMIDADEQITGAALEYSLNGSSFTVLSGFSAASGFYSYTAPADQIITYRCKVTFDNGQTHYSKTIRLQSGEMTGEPVVLSNTVTNGSVTVSNGKKQKYWLLDMQGRNLQTGYLNEGITTIPFQPAGSGIYLIKFSVADGNTCTKKILVQ